MILNYIIYLNGLEWKREWKIVVIKGNRIIKFLKNYQLCWYRKIVEVEEHSNITINLNTTKKNRGK